MGFMEEWIEENKEVLAQKEQEKQEDKKNVLPMKKFEEGKTILDLSKMIGKPTSKLFEWTEGNKSNRWFYHYFEYNFLVPETVHNQIVSLVQKFNSKGVTLNKVEVTAIGQLKNRKYTVLPEF